MTITAHQGPLISFGQSAQGSDYNSDIGPSLFYGGSAVLDPRAAYSYTPGQAFACGFATVDVQTLNITPATKSATAIAAAQHTTNGTAMTLVSSSGAGIVAGASVVNANTGATVTGLLAVGQAAARVTYGSSAAVQLWDPTTLTARALIITSSNASGTTTTFTVKGYDIYGYPMTENITVTPASALTTTGLKAWKYIASITPGATDATYNFSVGTTDVFGLPLASLQFGDLGVVMANAWITSNTGYVAAVNTTATATTGDVRGTYLVQTASDGSKPLVVYQTPTLAALALPNGVGGTSSGLFGVAQF